MDEISQFHPVFQTALRRIFSDLRALGWQPKIGSGMRTTAQQAVKVSKGYSKTMHSWHVPSTIGTLPATRDTYDVVHGNAADIVDSRYGWNGPASDRNYKFWKDLGKIAKKYGCEWGGDWKSFPDVAHVQMLFIEDAAHSIAFA